MVVTTATKQAIWLQKLMFDLGFFTLQSIPVYCDNQSCIKLVENPISMNIPNILPYTIISYVNN
jgi:hypothetical protein